MFKFILALLLVSSSAVADSWTISGRIENCAPNTSVILLTHRDWFDTPDDFPTSLRIKTKTDANGNFAFTGLEGTLQWQVIPDSCNGKVSPPTVGGFTNRDVADIMFTVTIQNTP